MPLIQITTKSDYYPSEEPSGIDLRPQKITGDLADALPKLFLANVQPFQMEADTPEAGIQVTHRKFHRRDVNAPDMWILIEFSEGDLNDTEQTEVTGKVKEMLLNWFRENNYELPTDYACDVRWSPSHGFLRIGGTVAEW